MNQPDARSSGKAPCARSPAPAAARRAGREPGGALSRSGRHERETRALRRLPHAVGPASRVAAAGDWFATALLGVPVLLSRGDDAVLRAFINVCRHRGSVVAAEGEVRPRPQPLRLPVSQLDLRLPRRARRPAARGRLPARAPKRGVPGRAAGGRALRPGLGRARSHDRLRLGRLFRAAAAELERLGYDAVAASPHERRFVQPSNWKLVLDANLESYHFQYAHRATIAHLFHDNLVQQQSFGRHQRIVLPKRSLAEAAASAGTVSWDLLGRHSNIIYFFFPSTFLLWEGDHVNGFSVTPDSVAAAPAPAGCWSPRTAMRSARPSTGAATGRSSGTRSTRTSRSPPRCSAAWPAARTGASSFGRNEFACELFERELEAWLAGQPPAQGPAAAS